MRIFSSSQSLSATFVAVTEPKSDPVGPALTSKRSSVASSRAAIACASSTVCASCRARCASRRSSSRSEPGRRELGEPARQQVVARVAARDVHHLAAQAEALDVLTQDDLHLAVSAVSAVAAVAAAAALAVVAALGHVRQQRHLAGALDRDRAPGAGGGGTRR